MHSFKYVPAFDGIHLGIIFKLASADMKQLFRIVNESEPLVGL